jgi:predicted transposase YbfD/YdcC
MNELGKFFEKLDKINDKRQQGKIKHKIMDVIAIALISMLANCDEWEDMQMFAVLNEDFFRKYLELPNGIPSHDTLNRVMGMIDPQELQKLTNYWQEIMQSNEGEKLKRILNIDGKTMRESGNKNQKPFHIVSAWSKEDGICFGQTVVKDKENEIVAIPELLDNLNIKEQIITIDAMGTQTEIANKIIHKKGDYVLALKANQHNTHLDVLQYFEDSEFKENLKKSHNGYKVTTEKARGQIEKREYYQTDDISWLNKEKRWMGLKTIGMVEKTIKKDDKITVEKRFYISSLPIQIELFEKAVRGHWSIESMHWHLDVTFREDNNSNLDKNTAVNLNILRKLSLSILKLIDIGRKCSVKSKRLAVGWNPAKFLEMAMNV